MADRPADGAASPHEVAEIEARWARAAPGPWSWYKARTLLHLNGPAGNFAQVSMPASGLDGYEANADAIAAAPTDIARLLSSLRAVERERDQAREAVLREVYEQWAAKSDESFDAWLRRALSPGAATTESEGTHG